MATSLTREILSTVNIKGRFTDEDFLDCIRHQLAFHREQVRVLDECVRMHRRTSRTLRQYLEASTCATIGGFVKDALRTSEAELYEDLRSQADAIERVLAFENWEAILDPDTDDVGRR